MSSYYSRKKAYFTKLPQEAVEIPQQKQTKEHEEIADKSLLEASSFIDSSNHPLASQILEALRKIDNLQALLKDIPNQIRNIKLDITNKIFIPLEGTTISIEDELNLLYWSDKRIGRLITTEYKTRNGGKYIPNPQITEVICSDCNKQFNVILKTWWHSHFYKDHFTCPKCLYKLKKQRDEEDEESEQRRQQYREYLLKLKNMAYSEYLQTEHWKQLRKQALKKAWFKCQVCNSKGLLEVHHRTYERLGQEYLSDLTVLCNPCHSKYHDKLPKYSLEAKS